MCRYVAVGTFSNNMCGVRIRTALALYGHSLTPPAPCQKATRHSCGCLDEDSGPNTAFRPSSPLSKYQTIKRYKHTGHSSCRQHRYQASDNMPRGCRGLGSQTGLAPGRVGAERGSENLRRPDRELKQRDPRASPRYIPPTSARHRHPGCASLLGRASLEGRR